MRIYFFISAMAVLLWNCTDYTNSSITQRKANYPSKKYTHVALDTSQLAYQEKVYVPAYSDIYNFSGEKTIYLTITLSVRNTSFKDSLFVNDIKYYGSDGKILRHYLDSSLVLHPMESVEFVIEHNETQGGAGANFVVDWGTHQPQLNHPVIQAVMISTISQQGISFVTHGVVIEKNHKIKEEKASLE
ncbi:DUF3124 domain-containing protein [Rapidithrix thailandica]|uniref:DUF3124 domain-containing protein n=1 Tax=Rapidithrix thailandica TaxID=413964 RepID=A0AAW9SET8_9BACT